MDEIVSDELEIVQYGLETLGNRLIGFIITVVIGGCFGHWRDGLEVWLILYPLRRYAGGVSRNNANKMFVDFSRNANSCIWFVCRA